MGSVKVVTAVLSAMALVGCASPESQCRDGVATMKGEFEGVIGSSGNKSRHAPVVKAHTHLDMAQTQLATGNFEGCVESLEKARAAIKQ